MKRQLCPFKGKDPEHENGNPVDFFGIHTAIDAQLLSVDMTYNDNANTED